MKPAKPANGEIAVSNRSTIGRATSFVAAAAVVAAIASTVLASPAHAAFGDEFGIAPVNTPDGQAVPAYPGQQAFWAGACDLAGAPAIGEPIPPPGTGTRPATVQAGDTGGVTDGYRTVMVPAPAVASHCIDHGDEGPYPPVPNTAIWTKAPEWRLPGAVQAGGHPDGTATFAIKRRTVPEVGVVDGAADNFVVDLPAGFVGDPTAVPKCSAEDFAAVPKRCPVASQVGILQLNLKASIAGNLLYVDLQILPVYNLEPRRGNVAELGFGTVSDVAPVSARIVAKARTNGDFGVKTFIGQIPAALPVINQTITLWGVPWAASHDAFRAPQGLQRNGGVCAVQPGSAGAHTIPPSGLSAVCRRSYEASWGPIRPFLSNLTECDPANPVTHLAMDSYQNQGAMTPDGDPDLSDSDWKTAESAAEPVTGCQKLPFDPTASFVPTSTGPDAASGLNVDIDVPQNDDPPASVAVNASDADGAPAHWKSDAGLASSQLDKTVVTLPEGMSVNPSGATGLQGCSDAQMGVTAVGNPYRFNNTEPSCPDGSRIGTVEATTPLLDETLAGEMILGSPKSTNPTSGEMFRMFLVLRNEERGLLAKIHGTATADPGTGRVTATFDKNPRVPVEDIQVDVKGGSRGLLATPLSCGQKTVRSVFTPWTAAHNAGGTPDTVDSSFAVGGDCSLGFAPALAAGMDNQAARRSGTFSFRFSRPAGDQYLRGLTAVLPKGLLASVKDLPLCSNAQANAGACPQGSKIGIVDAKAGAGDPFVLEQKGEVFLTEGYNGGEYGLAVKIRPIAGPFRGAMELSPIVVRQSIRVDRTSAQVTAVSDPLPTIHHGVPLRVREVTVLVNRGGFMLNPSDCEPKQVGAAFGSDRGAVASRSSGFQAAGCSRLAFKPRLSLRLTGRKQTRTGKHPGVKAVVRQAGVPEAGIERAEVRLPKALALDVNNAQALCEYADGTKPDLERHCPKGSIIGRARAVSPLLNRPLVGNVYFVKNVRRSSTGNLIQTLPMLVVALRGEISVNLKGTSNVKRGKLVNTFADVPDAPISQFNLNVRGGKNGILAVTRTRRSKINLCAAGRQVAEVDMDGQNGRRHDFNVTMKKPCRKAKKTVCKTRRQKATKTCKTKAKRTKARRQRADR